MPDLRPTSTAPTSTAPASTVPASPRTARNVVVDTLARVLGVDARTIRETDDLGTLTTYTSFRILDVVESVETVLGVEVASDDLRPANLRHLDSLCAVFLRATEAEHV